MPSTTTINSCRCGSTTHLRTSHRECPLNQSGPYERQGYQSCPSCGSHNHRRSTHRNCPNNSNNLSAIHNQERTEIGISAAVGIIQSDRSISGNCPRCGSSTHRRATNLECPFNTKRNTTNQSTTTVSLYKIARTIPFVPENIVGENICQTDGPLYHQHIFPRMESRCPFCNVYMWVDKRLKASSIQNPRFGLCCSNGKITLPLPIAPPQELLDFVTNHDAGNEQCVNFHTNIRAFNNAFAFVSIKANVDENLASGRNGVSTFRVNGTMYHNVGALRAQNGTSAGFSQIYFSDTNEQLARRTSLFSGLDPLTVEAIQSVIQRVNPYARSLMSVAEQFQNQPFGSLQVIIRAARDAGRRYDIQSSPEVAAMVIEENVDGNASPHDVLISDRTTGLRSISSMHPGYIPLHYVLMFPFGDDGWHMNLESVPSNPSITNLNNQPVRITILEHCCYFLMIRDGSYLHHYGRLFQQYIVDNYVRIETSRLLYLRLNQDGLRAEMYKGIGDNIEDPRQIGKAVVLPSTFTGEPRYMKQMLQDGLAIIRSRGVPALFVTFTCNPQWPEITRELNGQKAQDRPDICVRVFNLKMKEMIKHILDTKCFGDVSSYIGTVEFQKRGLPHVHLLFILMPDERPRTPVEFDNFVCAELPDPITHPKLYNTVVKSMTHGPCGTAKPDAPCMHNGICTKGYPKAFIEETRVSSSGYPLYRRRNNGQFHIFGRGHFVVTNQHVVPYNPYLCHKYDAHINVEICSTTRAIKYLCKYLTKGSDRAQVEISNENSAVDSGHRDQPVAIDEITEYQNARYIGPCEAVWRTFSVPIHMHHPMVSRLSIHLPDEQYVNFWEDMPAEELRLARDSLSQGTKLLAFFQLCACDENARQYTYNEIPKHFTWMAASRTWKARSRPPFKDVVSRIYAASPSNMELFCLRMLLLKVRGPTSFSSIKTVDGIVHGTFQQAALALGLLADDNEWDKCMDEARQLSPSASIIRALFTYILTNCSPSNPSLLWEKYKDDMADDYFFEILHTLPTTTMDLNEEQKELILKRALGSIQSRLQVTGHNLLDYPTMPQEFVTDMGDIPILEALEMAEKRGYDAEEERQALEVVQRMFNTEQKIAYDQIVASLNLSESDPQNRLFFVDGPGGTGKSLLFKALLNYVRSKDEIALPVATSGIAAILLPSGRTAHSRFKIPLDANHDSSCGISLGSSHARLLQKAKLFLWNEAVMCNKHSFEAVDRCLRDIMGAVDPVYERIPFGGKVFVFGGDFRQILPVVKKGTRSQVVGECLNRASFWRFVKVFHLTQNMRVSQSGPLAAEFAAKLSAIGNGDGEHEHSLELPPQWCIDSESYGTLIHKVYPQISSINQQPYYYSHNAILAPTNNMITQINDVAIEIFPGDIKEYCSLDTVMDSDDPDADNARYPVEFLNYLTCSGIPPHILKLKIGMPLLIMRNVDPEAGLCNGTKVFVTTFTTNIIGVKRLDQGNNGIEYFLPRFNMTTNEGEFPFKLSRRQFPVRAAFAMTINKSQGQTLSHVGVYLEHPVFSHGQLYVALSRATDPTNVCVAVPKNVSTTKNVVYKEVLL